MFSYEFPEKYHKVIIGVEYFRKYKEILFIFNHKRMLSILLTKKVIRREIEFPETFVDYTLAKSMGSMFCVGTCGKIYNLNIKFYFKQEFEQIAKAKLENWRMLCKPMQSFE